MEKLTAAWEQARAMVISALTEYVISRGNVVECYVFIAHVSANDNEEVERYTFEAFYYQEVTHKLVLKYTCHNISTGEEECHTADVNHLPLHIIYEAMRRMK